MAKFIKAKTTFFNSDTTGCEVELPTGYSAGDLLLFIAAKDDATGGSFTTPAGWTKHGENNNGASGNNTVRGAIYYLIAASSSETNPIVTSTDADAWSAVCVAISGIDSGTLIDISNGNGITDSVGNPYPAASVTTTVSNTMVIYGICSDGGVSPTSPPGFILMGIADSGTCACALAYKMMPTAGASGVCDFYASGQADESVLFTLALRDGSSGAILSGHVNSDCATIVRPLKGANLTFSGDALDSNSNNFTKLAGAWISPDIVYQVDASGPTFTDVTAAATNATDADLTITPVEATGDYIAYGFSSIIIAFRFDRAGCTAGTAGVVAEEYLSTSGTWKALPNFFDSTNNLTAAVADHQICGWSMPLDWTSVSLNGVSKFWWRQRVTTVYTVNPTISQVFGSTSPALHHDTLTGLGDSGVSQIMDSTYVTPGFSGNLMCGGAYSMVSVQDLSTARLMGTFLFGGPRDHTDNGPRSAGGVSLGLIDSTNLVKAWVVGASDSSDTYPRRDNIFVIQVGQSVDTSWIDAAPDTTDVKRILLMTNCKFGACNAAFNPLINCGTLKIYGGGTDTPVDYDELIKLANGYPCPMIDRITNICYTLVQIGGDFPVNFQISGKTIIFPKQATVANNVTSFHVDENVVGWLIDPRAGDTCNMTNFTLTSESTWRLEVLATADAAADTDFSGLSVTNANVTLRTFPFIGSSFIGCPTFTLVSGASLDSCAITDTTVLAADVDDIADCQFVSGGTGHAIEATAAGTYTFDGNTFTGYGADATTDAAFYNNSGGLITLNLANYGEQIPTVRNGAGASTTIVNKPNVATVTGIIAGSRIQVYNATTATEVANEVVAGTSWTLNYQEGADFTDGDSVRIRLTRQSGVTAYLGFTTGAVAGATGWSVLAAQVVDSVYGTLAIDGSTITDYSADYANDEVDIVVATDFDLSEMYAWWVYNLTTPQGIADFFGGITAVDEGNFRNHNAVVSIKLDNTTTISVYALDNRRLFRSDGARPVRNPTSGGGGIDVEWREPVLIASSSLSAADVWAHGARTLTGIGSSGIASETNVTAVGNALATHDANLNTKHTALVTEHDATQAAIALIPDGLDNALAVRTELADELLQVTEMHRLRGLDVANPMTTTTTDITAGDITVVLTGDGTTTVTATRQP
jgi:hypothetical protein